MTGKFKPCIHILPPAQRRLWPELKNAPNLGFSLYGGTAIALRLGHRNFGVLQFSWACRLHIGLKRCSQQCSPKRQTQHHPHCVGHDIVDTEQACRLHPML